MSVNNNSGITGGSFIAETINPRATQSEKEKKDFQRMKDIMDHIDIYYGDYRDYDRINKNEINYNLINGHLDVKLYEDPLCFSVGMEEISFDYQNISHTPLIAQYANAIIGEEIALPFVPMVKDNSPDRLSMLKKKAEKVNKEYIMNTIINPVRTQIMNGILSQMEQTDVFSLANTPEKQLELEQQINIQLEQEIPKDILEFLNGKVDSTTARQAQKMLNFLVDRFSIKFEKTKGFKNAVATGEEYYYCGEYNGGLLFKAINPSYFQWGGGDRENEWSQFADWNKYERWLSYQQLISRHSDKLELSDYKLIDLDVEPIGGFSRGSEFWDRDAAHTKKFMYTFSAEEGFKEAFSDVNIKTKEGRRKLFHMYDLAFSRYADKYGTNYSDYGIREAHIQWRDLRKMWIVTRIMPNGIERDFWLPEHYEPTHKDYNVREAWVNQAWEGWKLGSFDCTYAGIRELPYQYKSMFNPNDVDLSYYGKKYHVHDGITKNVALVDPAKSAQKNFDMVLASIRHDMTTNHGKVFTMFMNMKPEGWSYQEWLDVMRNAGILMLDPTRNNAGIDPQFLKPLELSKVSDIAHKVQLLELYRSQVALSMYFNDAREGQISEYANATNINQNVQAVHNKTAFFMEQHRIILEKALAGFLNVSRHYYKEHPEEASIFLDDISLADLQNAPLSWYEWLGIEVKNSHDEIQKLKVVKNNILGFIQNTASPESVMQLIFADTISEVSDIVRAETVRVQKEAEKRFQESMALEKQRSDSNLQEKQMEFTHDMQKLEKTLASQEKRTLYDREKFLMQNDVDKNQINDIIQKTIIELQAKMQMQDKDLLFQREELELKEKLELAKLRNEKINVKKQTTNQ